MTKNQTRATAQTKAESPVEEPVLMDPNPTPSFTGEAVSARVAYALRTLVTEFQALFPETAVEYSNHTRFGVALDVTFDLTSCDTDDATSATRLLDLIRSDGRVGLVITEDGAVLVSLNENPHTQDDRTTFGLAQGYSILTGASE